MKNNKRFTQEEAIELTHILSDTLVKVGIDMTEAIDTLKSLGEVIKESVKVDRLNKGEGNMTQYTSIGRKVCEGQEGDVLYQMWCNQHHVYTVIAKNVVTQQQFRDTYQGVVSWWFGEDEVDTEIINQKLDMVIKKARDEANS